MTNRCLDCGITWEPYYDDRIDKKCLICGCTNIARGNYQIIKDIPIPAPWELFCKRKMMLK